MSKPLINELNPVKLQEYLDFAIQLAQDCAPIAKSAFRQGGAFIMKEDNSPVTEVDQAIERILREQIEIHYPEHGILGEEYDNVGLDRDFIWVLDPIDGTKQFASGHHGFGTLIALTYKNRPILGVINQPVTGECWAGAEGMATTLNGQPISVRQCHDIDQAVLAMSSPNYFTGTNLPRYQRLEAAACWSVYGGGCIAYGCLAGGLVDICLDANFDPFDYMALVPIVEGAGGVMTDWKGNSLTLASDGKLLASGSLALHQKALTLLN